MADTSLVTKEHLRITAERVDEKIEESAYSHPAHTARSSGLYKITVDALGHVSSVTAATKADITNLGVPAQDTVYTHPTHTARSSGLYKITVDNKGHVTAVTAVTKDDITALGIPGSNTDTVYTHPSYTARSSGLYKITVDGTGHVSAVTAATKADITNLGIPAQDTVYTHPSYIAKSSGLYKITVDATGHVSAVTAATKADITALGIPAQDTTYSAATTSAAGLMSPDDKVKLDGIEAGATAGGSGGISIANAESSDGVTYTATVDGIDALTAGQLVVFLSTKTSASTAPTLNINSLGAKTIKRRLSNLSSTTTSGAANNWLYANKPQLMMYDGTYWVVVNQDKPVVSDLYGSISNDYTVSVPVSWTADSTNGGYYQTVSVSGITADDTPIADVVLGSDVDANALYMAAWALVTRVITGASSITLYANGEAPTTAFTIMLKVIA